ncbi:bacteriocin-like peptide, LSEI_2386 family [Lacticaseibacillus rhamnosus]|uniref:bacteriocin-like peptide, LSEI_2386 family n=1 Tax=Lacticaseibacillus rhamnosus TaxID=47715 RepID=UPI000235B595|nr:hypothetical protein [Lacticaseibacillus rhamnosus]EHJ21520.1 hypothetical protein R0011_10750 [Lacticaseibacillus rhamnosus R0011]MBB6656199.1 hypothetical protein [Lacticaseibacillus rhamnosus]MBU5979869.1 hypothetical protein [Lacticaseibacillus rhamnosus]MDM7524789.1 hypothetical protein [Lacticaseibacillus rhamnosus]NUB69360.1 hypothetical protein [Lacticaseibacillus rhamnosus]
MNNKKGFQSQMKNSVISDERLVQIHGGNLRPTSQAFENIKKWLIEQFQRKH